MNRTKHTIGLHGYTIENLSNLSPGERMKLIGIYQDGEMILRKKCRPFNLPKEKGDALKIIEQLESTLETAQQIHTFAKGLGLAVPQIGIDRAIAIVVAKNEKPLILLNPKITNLSKETDEQYEGCWSFFDYRGLVSRPIKLEITYQSIEGKNINISASNGQARLIAHEIDHLNGILYKDHLLPDKTLLSYEQYQQKKEPWKYQS